MITKILIYNRFHMNIAANLGFENIHHTNWNLISIYSENDVFITPKIEKFLEKKGCHNFLSLNFSDITDKEYKDIKKNEKKNNKEYNVTLFNKEHARKIIRFINNIEKDKSPSVLLIHCDAGISRSGAIGTFVNDYCGLSYNEFIEENPYIRSNQYILKLLRDVSGFRPLHKCNDGIVDDYSGNEIIIPKTVF